MKRLAFLLAFSALGAPAAAQGLSGWAELKGFGYADRVTEREPYVLGWATLFLKEEAALGPVRLVASARAEAITSAERGPLVFDPADRALRRSPLSVHEMWLRVPLASGVDLSAGRFLLGWGKTDGYSPADAFLPRDLTDPFADEKLPLWGARLTGQRGDLRLELVGTATTTPFRLPVLEGRHAPLAVTPPPPFERVFLVDGAQDPPRAGFAAMRLSLAAGAWDLGAWGRAGVRPAPLLTIRTDEARITADGIALPADRRFAHESGVGLEASRVLGAFVLRAEAAALFSADPELGDALIVTGGAERAFGDGTLALTVATNLRGTPVDPSLLFDRALLPAVIAVWQRSERWGSWRVVAMHALKHGDGLLKAEVTDALTDAWGVTLGVDLPFGSRYGPFGARPSSRRARLALRLGW